MLKQIFKNYKTSIIGISIIVVLIIWQVIHYYTKSTDNFNNVVEVINNLSAPLIGVIGIYLSIHGIVMQTKSVAQSDSQRAFDLYFKLFQEQEKKFDTLRVDEVLNLGVDMRITPHYGSKAFQLILKRDASQLENNYEVLKDLKRIVNELVYLANEITKKDFENRHLILAKYVRFYNDNLCGLWVALEQKYSTHIEPNSFPPLKQSLIALDLEMKKVNDAMDGKLID